MDRRLEGKVAIITSAGTGIGEAIAHKFAKEGAAVVVNGLPEDPIEDVAQKNQTLWWESDRLQCRGIPCYSRNPRLSRRGI